MNRYNRRKSERIPFSHACRLQSGEHVFYGIAENLSVSGVGLVLKEPCTIIAGTCALLEIHLETHSAQMTVSIKSQVAWNDAGTKLGLQFLDLADSGIETIRRIVDVHQCNPKDLRSKLDLFIHPLDSCEEKEGSS
jgi:hypothetical protein